MKKEEHRSLFKKESHQLSLMIEPDALPDYAYRICNETSTQIELARFAFSIAAVITMAAKNHDDGPKKKQAEKQAVRAAQIANELCDLIVSFRIHKDRINAYLLPLIEEIKKGKK